MLVFDIFKIFISDANISVYLCHSCAEMVTCHYILCLLDVAKVCKDSFNLFVFSDSSVFYFQASFLGCGIF